jgi:hypothetical protein
LILAENPPHSVRDFSDGRERFDRRLNRGQEIFVCACAPLDFGDRPRSARRIAARAQCAQALDLCAFGGFVDAQQRYRLAACCWSSAAYWFTPMTISSRRSTACWYSYADF